MSCMLADLDHWWELGPADRSSTSGAGGGSAEGTTPVKAEQALGAAAVMQDSITSASAVSPDGSNIVPVPGTSLLFDKRSLRARRPSVRFRNTVHVQDSDGVVVPLHVSSYAVLVTDVPDLNLRAGGDDGSSDSGDSLASSGSLGRACQLDGVRPGDTLCSPWVHALRFLWKCLDKGMQMAV